MRWAVVALALLVAGCSGPSSAPAGDAPFTGDVQQDITDGIVVANGTGVVAGHVRNVAGVALADVFVFLIGMQGSTRSDSQGAFALEDVPPGTHRIRFDRANYLALERDVEVRDGRITRLNVTLADNAPGGPGFREHLHDRWRGADELVIFDGVVRHAHEYVPDGPSLLPCVHGLPASSTSSVCYEMEIVPEDGTIIPPGTERLSVFADWENQQFVQSTTFRYQPANETEARVTGPILPGETIEVPVEYPMTDHGHQVNTLWIMELIARPMVGPVSISSEHLNEHTAGDFRVKVVAHRGEIPPEQPHRRFWANGSELVLLAQETHTITGAPRARDPGTSHCVTSSACFVLPGQATVPPGTTRLQVTLEYAAGTPALEAQLSKKTLAFRTAATRAVDATLDDLRVETPVESPWGRTVYELEIAEGEADPFYQPRSTWLFLLANEGDERGERFVEDCFHFVVGCGGSSYTLRVVAINDDWTPELAGIG